MKEIVIYRCSCNACGKVFCGITQAKANAEHKKHIKKCDTIIAIKKVEHFRKACEEILGRKVTTKEAAKLLSIKW